MVSYKNIPYAEFIEYSVEEIRNILSERTNKLNVETEPIYQQLFCLDQELKKHEAQERELKFELDSLNPENDAECKELQSELQSIIENDKILLNQNDKEKREQAENLSNENAKIDQIQNGIQLLQQRIHHMQVANKEKMEADMATTLVLLLIEKSKLEQLKVAEISKNKIMAIEIKEEEDELQCIKEKVKYTGEQGETVKKKIEEIQSEIAGIQGDIASNNAPSLGESSRGNSMFAEVYDNTVKFEKHYELIALYYNEMQSAHAGILHQIGMYTEENEKMRRDFRKELERMKEEHHKKVARALEQIEQDKSQYAEKKQLFDSATNIRTKDLPFGHDIFMATSYKKTEACMQQMLVDMIRVREESIGITKSLSEANVELKDKKVEHREISRKLCIISTQFDVACKEKNVTPTCICRKVKKVSAKAGLFKFAQCKK